VHTILSDHHLWGPMLLARTEGSGAESSGSLLRCEAIVKNDRAHPGSLPKWAKLIVNNGLDFSAYSLMR